MVTSEGASRHRLPSSSQHAAPATPGRHWEVHPKTRSCASLALPLHAAVISCLTNASESYTTSIVGTTSRMRHAPPQECCLEAERPAKRRPESLTLHAVVLLLLPPVLRCSQRGCRGSGLSPPLHRPACPLATPVPVMSCVARGRRTEACEHAHSLSHPCDWTATWRTSRNAWRSWGHTLQRVHLLRSGGARGTYADASCMYLC